MRMIEYNQLKIRRNLLAGNLHQPKEGLNCSSVGILLDLVQPTFRTVWRIVRLSWLIEYEERWYRAFLHPKPPMKCEVSEHMVADPVLATTHPVKWYRAVQSVRECLKNLPLSS